MPAKKPTHQTVYRTAFPGVVIRIGGSLDDSPKPKGTIIDPASVDAEDAARLLGRGLLVQISLPAPSTPLAAPSLRGPETVPPVVLPSTRTAYRVATGGVVVRKPGSPDQTPYPKDALLPAEANMDDVEHLLALGLVTEETHPR